MKLTKIYTGVLFALAFCTCGIAGAQTTVVTLADAAADYVESLSAVDAEPDVDADPTPFPAGWTYLVSDTASGGSERELAALAGVGNGGNTGFGTEGSGFQIPAVLGNQNLGEQFEVFGDGFDGNGGNVPTGNEGVVGVDLLMVPGFVNEADPQLEEGELGDSFVIARYTISAAEASGAVAETGSITGNFRDLVARDPINANQGGSVDVFIYQNGNVLFSVDRPNDIANGGMLLQADGTFNITGLTFAAGDTIDFIVGNNENVGGDETALQASISVESSGGGVLLGDCDCNGVINFDDIGPFIGFLSSDDFKAEADTDESGEINFADIPSFISILSGS